MTDKPLRKDLRCITLEGSAYCVMAGLGESSLQPFVLALGYGQHVAGWIATLPQFLGSILQNFSPWAIQRVGSLRRFSVMTVALQALAFLPLAIAAWTQALPLWAIFAAVALYWAGGLSTGAAWNTWMETVVPRSIRPKYFARRSSMCNLLHWSSMLAAGALLSYAGRSNQALVAFGGLFLLAGLARAAGAALMAQQSEREPLPKGYTVMSFAEAVGVLRNSSEAGLLRYLLGAQLALQIAVPFLAPYLLGPLKLTHWQYMAVFSTAVLARITALPLLANWARQWGARGLLRISGIGLAVVPLLWLWSGAPLAYCLAVQVVTGFLMAAYDLALMFVYLEAIPAAQRPSVLTRFRMFDTLSMFTGSLIGGGLLMLIGQNLLAYKVIFILSSAARLLALKALPGPTEAAPAEQPSQEASQAPCSGSPRSYSRRHRSAVHRLYRHISVVARRRPRTLVPGHRAPRS